jgi:antitoxin FitA
MPVNLSIRNVPDDVADRLRARAKQNHRSLQGELMVIFQDATRPEGPDMREGQREYRTEQPAREKRKSKTEEPHGRAKKHSAQQSRGETGAQMMGWDHSGHPTTSPQPLDAVEALKQMRTLGVRTKDEVVRMIREDRDR